MSKGKVNFHVIASVIYWAPSCSNPQNYEFIKLGPHLLDLSIVLRIGDQDFCIPSVGGVHLQQQQQGGCFLNLPLNT